MTVRISRGMEICSEWRVNFLSRIYRERTHTELFLRYLTRGYFTSECVDNSSINLASENRRLISRRRSRAFTIARVWCKLGDTLNITCREMNQSACKEIEFVSRRRKYRELIAFTVTRVIPRLSLRDNVFPIGNPFRSRWIRIKKWTYSVEFFASSHLIGTSIVDRVVELNWQAMSP